MITPTNGKNSEGLDITNIADTNNNKNNQNSNFAANSIISDEEESELISVVSDEVPILDENSLSSAFCYVNAFWPLWHLVIHLGNIFQF